MSLLTPVLLLAVMCICCTGPGLFVLRQRRLTVDERLCTAIGLSLILTYLVATAIYLFNVDWRACWLWTGACLVMLALSAGPLVRKSRVRAQLAAFGFLVLLGLLLLAVIRHYSGGQWFADWVCHYQRAIYFLRRPPGPADLFGGDVIPSRPPLMNMLVAFFLAHGSDGFDMGQVIFMALSLLVFFACVLWAGHLVKFGNRRVWLIAAIVALNPMVLQNSTWTWTKLLSAYFVLVSIALYLRSMRKNDPARIILASIMMAAAIITHYSAAPYAIAIAVHYITVFSRRRFKSTEIFAGGSAAVALLLSWFAWALIFYGPQATWGSNTSVLDSSKFTWTENLSKVGLNAISTFVPFPLRVSWTEFHLDFDQPSRLGLIRDYFFLLYQGNLPFTLGSLGCIGAIWLLIRQIARSTRTDLWFWTILIVISTAAGIASTGTPHAYGVAHVCLQPLTLLGLSLLAGGWSKLPTPMRAALVLGMAVDASLGILIHFRLESAPILMISTAGAPIIPLQYLTLNVLASMHGWIAQTQHLTFFAEHFVGLSLPIQLASAVLIAIALFIGAKNTKGPQNILIGSVLLILFCGAFLCTQERSLSYQLTDTSPGPYAKGAALYEQGQLSPALDALTNAYLSDPQDHRPRYLLSVMLMPHRIQLTDTDARFAEAVLRDPENSAALAALRAKLEERHLFEKSGTSAPAIAPAIRD